MKYVDEDRKLCSLVVERQTFKRVEIALLTSYILENKETVAPP